MINHSRIVTSLHESVLVTLPVILCLFTGTKPEFAAIMPRDPAPPTGMPFDEGFVELLAGILQDNAAVHDGAIMLGRKNLVQTYEVMGWSYRLHPPATQATVPNKGSAFNSCVAMSWVPGVDVLYLASRGGTFRFHCGQVEAL